MSCQTLFDTGSQRSFVLNSVANALDLAVVGKCEIAINGFNSCSEIKEYLIVTCIVSCDSEIIKFDAVVVDKMPKCISMPG